MFYSCYTFVFTVLLLSYARAEKFKPNDFAVKLLELNVTHWDIPILACLAYRSSDLTTGYSYTYMSFLGPTPVEYGIFGLPEDVFRGSSPCQGMKTSSALDADLEDDLRCINNILFTQNSDGLSRSSRNNLRRKLNLKSCYKWWNSLPHCFPTKTEVTNEQKLDRCPMEVMRCTFSFLASTNLTAFLAATLLCVIIWMGYLVGKILTLQSPHQEKSERVNVVRTDSCEMEEIQLN
ncbi:Hypothetical protein NTJ_01906 [Nesidiocoris tenuis]|uniref:Uncharacterized protein n=1 Tax=Nesidiocoris tenuis TaxID=355587 RepID=A0ABN7A9W2_9HEMI|nr:Hypothetical protein NTJ_01906 [Nesidiocoris tenuis]